MCTKALPHEDCAKNQVSLCALLLNESPLLRALSLDLKRPSNGTLCVRTVAYDTVKATLDSISHEGEMWAKNHVSQRVLPPQLVSA